MRINEPLYILLNHLDEYSKYRKSANGCECWFPFFTDFNSKERYEYRIEIQQIKSLKNTTKNLLIDEKYVKGTIPRLLSDILYEPYRNAFMLEVAMTNKQIELIYAFINEFMIKQQLSNEFKRCLSNAYNEIIALQTGHNILMTGVTPVFRGEVSFFSPQ